MAPNLTAADKGFVIDRRAFLATIGVAAAWPVAGGAQQKPMRVIGWLSGGSAKSLAETLDFRSFYQGLAETGYVNGQNLAFEYRFAETSFDRLPALAADLVAHKVDVIFANSGVPGARAAREATATIPIVFTVGVDPVERGLVESLAHPGANLTGITSFGPELNQKRLELLSELAADARLVAVLVNPTNPTMPRSVEKLPAREQEVARSKKLEFRIVSASTEVEIDTAFQTMAEMRADVLLIRADPLFYVRHAQLASLALHHSIPAIHDWRKFAEAGGLISYGVDHAEIAGEIGNYLGKILNGAKPFELPVLQPTKFELVINLKTANALGLTIPPSILARADGVIE